MKKTISLVAWKRPEYTAQVLESLAANDTRSFSLHIQLEPGCEEVLKLCKSINFIETHISVNAKVMGINNNNFTLLDRLFSNGLSDFNVYLEDDTVLSPDALALVNWFLNKPDYQKYLVLCLRRWKSNAKDPIGVFSDKWFNPWGFACTKEQWDRYLKHFWHLPEKENPHMTWDYSVQGALKSISELYAIAPSFSRTRNIGRDEGVNCSKEEFDSSLLNKPCNTEHRIVTFEERNSCP